MLFIQLNNLSAKNCYLSHIYHQIQLKYLPCFRYLYLDDVILTTTKALHLAYCAEKYDVKVLKAKCIEFLLGSVNGLTWAEILDHAVFFNEASLTKACLRYLTCGKRLETEGLEEYHITRQTVEVILDYDQLSMREVDIFKFCQTWSEQECEEKDIPVNMANKRKMLGPLLRKIPFCSMKQEEFVTEVSGQNFLNGQEELQVLRYLCAADKSNPPFPCMKQRETKNLTASLHLPDVWDISQGGVYTFSIKCTTQGFTLIGLTFTEPGSFLVSYGSIVECLEVQPETLTVYLKEAVYSEAGTMLKIQDAQFEYPHEVNIDFPFPFSSYVNSKNSDLYKKLDFVIMTHNDSSKPPFDTLIVRL